MRLGLLILGFILVHLFTRGSTADPDTNLRELYQTGFDWSYVIRPLLFVLAFALLVCRLPSVLAGLTGVWIIVVATVAHVRPSLAFELPRYTGTILNFPTLVLLAAFAMRWSGRARTAAIIAVLWVPTVFRHLMSMLPHDWWPTLEYPPLRLDWLLAMVGALCIFVAVWERPVPFRMWKPVSLSFAFACSLTIACATLVFDGAFLIIRSGPTPALPWWGSQIVYVVAAIACVLFAPLEVWRGKFLVGICIVMTITAVIMLFRLSTNTSAIAPLLYSCSILQLIAPAAYAISRSPQTARLMAPLGFCIAAIVNELLSLTTRRLIFYPTLQQHSNLVLGILLAMSIVTLLIVFSAQREIMLESDA